MAYAASALPIAKLTDPLTVARQNAAYTTASGCQPISPWSSTKGASVTSIQYTVNNCFDGLTSTFCHQDVFNAAFPSPTSLFFVVDLQVRDVRKGVLG
jgi:hypothetical protein